MYCIGAPSKRGRYWEIHPRCPKDFAIISRDHLKVGWLVSFSHLSSYDLVYLYKVGGQSSMRRPAPAHLDISGQILLPSFHHCIQSTHRPIEASLAITTVATDSCEVELLSAAPEQGLPRISPSKRALGSFVD